MTRQAAIFLDRDGVLIHDVRHLSKLEDIQIYTDVPKGLGQLHSTGFKLIMVTNQSGVARGYFPETFIRQSFEHINQSLSSHGVTLDHMYYCPHHPSGQKPYNIRCDCRKPGPGMIKQACEDYEIDLPGSFMLGDKICDIELAINSNITGLLLQTGQGESESMNVASKYPATPVLRTFTQAVNFILEKSNL